MTRDANEGIYNHESPLNSPFSLHHTAQRCMTLKALEEYPESLQGMQNQHKHAELADQFNIADKANRRLKPLKR